MKLLLNWKMIKLKLRILKTIKHETNINKKQIHRTTIYLDVTLISTKYIYIAVFCKYPKYEIIRIT